MATAPSRVIWIVIALVIGVGLGFWIEQRHEEKIRRECEMTVEKLRRDCDAEVIAARLAGSNVVYIGPAATTATPADLPISIKANDVAYWKPWVLGANHTVTITFKAAQFPQETGGQPPFVNGQVGKDQTVPCTGGICSSGAINPLLKAYFNSHPNVQELIYKYWQTLDGGGLVDGRIIIRP